MTTAIPYHDHGILGSLWPVKGTIIGGSHWKYCTYTGMGRGLEHAYEGYIDTSVTEEIQGRHCHPIYRVKEQGESWAISLDCTLVTPFYAAITIGYHLIRMIAVTVYLASRCLLYDWWAKDSQDSYISLVGRRIIQIGKENWRSLSTIIRTPICATGYLLSHLYVLLFDSVQWRYGDALNGRKMAAYFEAAWNRWTPLDKSIWLCNVVDCEHYEFEGNGNPEKLEKGDNGYYLAGCYQPIAFVELDKTNKISHLFTYGGHFVLNADPNRVARPLASGCCPSLPPIPTLKAKLL